MRTPASQYTSSSRKWDGVLRAPEYDTKAMKVRKVCPSGCLWLNQKEHYIGTALVGEYVGLKDTGENNDLEVYYGPIYLGKLTTDGLIKPKTEIWKRRSL